MNQPRMISQVWVFIKKYKYLLVCSLLVFTIWYIRALPEKLFSDPSCTVLLDRNGSLLGARIAADGQWRFAGKSTVPTRFRTCILQFEDRDFYSHGGISIRSSCRAFIQNCKAKRIVSGGSTISMQVMRLVRRNKARTFSEKILEMVLATRLEWSYTKDEILRLYASHAPFGSNVVGLEAASWRYFGRASDRLSWSEAATLAVLPNAPSLIYPGKNHQRLLLKRNRLLHRLLEAGVIDDRACQLALAEPLPEKPLDLPHGAQHLLNRAILTGGVGKVLQTTIDPVLQQSVSRLVEVHHTALVANKIYNAAVLVISVKTGAVLSYVGNTANDSTDRGSEVDIIQSPRSTGSILKPLLYAGMLNEGSITPRMLIPDVPTQIGAYTPKNFSLSYDGAVPANRALSRSLNIPAVRMLNSYGVGKFQRQLVGMGMTTLHHPASYYGLSLILGGAEAKLWDLAAIYARMARALNEYPHYKPGINSPPYFLSADKQAPSQDTLPVLCPSSIWSAFEAMVEVNRPEEEANWRSFSSSGKIAWKTGTSFGFRDAWAIGITSDYVVAVWVGNADGEGRPGLTGITAAAPLLFNVFAQLPASPWFRQPKEDMSRVAICRLSGHRASALCPEADTVYIPKPCLRTTACPYHQLIHLDRSGRWRVSSECEEVNRMKHEVFFVLPPLEEKYYRFNNPNYRPMPEYRTDCRQRASGNVLAILYPRKASKIYVPVLLDGSTGKTVFEATHRSKSAVVYWHLDDVFIAQTRDIHQVELNPAIGKHILLLVDENGNTVTQSFEVLKKEEEGQ
jgi:penicillin-binding protein 1C